MLALVNPWHGKIGRIHWWLSQIAIFCLAFGGLFATIYLFADPDRAADGRNPMENLGLGVTILAVIYMNLCTCLNRLRDSCRSGFWYLTFLLPTVGTGLMVYFCGIEKSPGRFTSGGAPAAPGRLLPAPPKQPTQPAKTSLHPAKDFGRRNRGAA